MYLVILLRTYIRILKMPSVVISDTSTLILLHKINEFNLLRSVYGTLMTTPEIAAEFGEELPTWITVVSVSDLKIDVSNRTKGIYFVKVNFEGNKVVSSKLLLN